MNNSSRRPQRRKTFRHEAGYYAVLIRDRIGRRSTRWTKQIPLASPTTPRPGTQPERSPFWPPFLNGWERGRLRADLAREAVSIFVAEAIKLGQIPPEKTVDHVLPTDRERLADEQEKFLEAVADAKSDIATDTRLHGDYNFLVAFGGVHWALARVGDSSAYDEFDDPDPRRQLIAAAQAHSFNPPYVDADGWVRLYDRDQDPPTDRADVLPIHISGATQ